MTTNADAWSKEFRRELQRRMHEAGVYDGKIDGKSVWENMEWALTGAPGAEALADYESRVNVLLRWYGDAVVCAYDVARFPSAIVKNVVRAHPYLLADGWGQENPHYVPPG